MNRRTFIASIAVVGFGNLFLPRALDRFRWKVPAAQERWDAVWNPDYVNAPYEETLIDIARCESAGLTVPGLWVPWPLPFSLPVDPSNREEVMRHSIPPLNLIKNNP